jgi:ABC-type multidrug transport system fused ATPase/permease subunit
MQKITKIISPFWWAIKLSWRTNRGLFAFTTISTLLTSSFSGVINTYLLAQATAGVALLASGSVSLRTPILWTLAFGLFNLTTDIIKRITYYFENKFNNQLDIKIQNMYANKVSSFTQEQLDNAEMQKSLSLANRELYSIRNASYTAQNIASSLFAYILAVVIVWRYAWGIGLLLMVLVPLLAISNAVQIKRRRKSWEESSMHWRISRSLMDYLTDPLRLFQLRIMGAKDKVLKLRAMHMNKNNDIELKAELKNTYIAFLEDLISPIIDIVSRVWAIVLVAGGKLAFDQFLFVIGLINQASSQTFNLGYSLSNGQETYLAATTLKELLEIPEPPDGDKKVTSAGQGGLDISLNNVSLTYPNGTTALSDITMDIKAGSKVAIVGENGAGKTTLLRLITRQYEATQGQILIGNQDIKNIKRNSLYQAISVLSQDFYLIDDLTIKQNLQLATKSTTPKQINQAIETVNLTSKIKSIPGGLNARLDKSYDDGIDLSGGQRQRLSIARTILKPFELLILDEPTSAIDAKAERNIFNSIFEKSKNATVLIVSHRFATVRKADFIYVIDNGKIIEQGTHQQLIALNGHYAELYNIQAQDFA